MGYAVVPSESTEHVSWFFDLLREGGWREALDDRGDESCLIVLLDRGTGLVAGVEASLPDAVLRHCFNHIERNIFTATSLNEWKTVKE